MARSNFHFQIIPNSLVENGSEAEESRGTMRKGIVGRYHGPLRKDFHGVLNNMDIQKVREIEEWVRSRIRTRTQNSAQHPPSLSLVRDKPPHTTLSLRGEKLAVTPLYLW